MSHLTDPGRPDAGGAETSACEATSILRLREFASTARVPGARVRLDLTEMPYIGSSTYDAEETRMIADAVSAAVGCGARGDGFVLVPAHPLPEMLAAFWRTKNTGTTEIGGEHWGSSDVAAYRAMIAASPAPSITEPGADLAGLSEDPSLVSDTLEILDALAAQREGQHGEPDEVLVDLISRFRALVPTSAQPALAGAREAIREAIAEAFHDDRRAELGVIAWCDSVRENQYLGVRAYAFADKVLAHVALAQAPALQTDPAGLRGGEEDTGTEWFWRIVDANGLGDVPSDEGAALRLLCRRAAAYQEASVERDFQLMLARVVRRYSKGFDLAETMAQARSLLTRKGDLSALREDEPAPPSVPAPGRTEA